ncbi:CsiV family protein [Reinekea blandensis]|uniref:Peptidoglycan-binding protein CsiV n=1 Tax=Reinekea blandensis MED297 TaxID=314283 RepID=A4BHN2_9GAMM|nr:CsiV family protein [Reinekea blandensis]EAR08430.1 hypothetical protein MED297_16859 [Reinekea blandensis MED297]
MKSKLIPTPILTLALLCLPLTSMAEDADDERWFQVEVLIFENPAMEVDNPEQWPTFPNISHPTEYLRLTGTQDIITENSETDLSPEELDSTPEETIERDAPVSRSGLDAFAALSEIERQLNEERQTLEDTRGFRVLFHEAWNQPVPGRDNVVPIRIDAGERFGRQAELQGYISLYVERYLHFSTDLHLIRYEETENPFNVVLRSGDANRQTPSTGALQAPTSTLQFSDLFAQPLQSNNQITRKADQYYVSTQSAQLKESRRMRSKQVHYLDNPEFGLLILITPIELQ